MDQNIVALILFIFNFQIFLTLLISSHPENLHNLQKATLPESLFKNSFRLIKKEMQTLFLNKLQVDLKLQHRISRSNSSSRYLENANSQDIFKWRHLYDIAEAVVQRCSAKKMFSKISQNLQENTCAKVIFSKVAGQRPADSSTVSSEFVRFFRVPILYNMIIICHIKQVL